MPFCKICKEIAIDGIHLSDGGMIHELCLEHIEGRAEEVRNEIFAQRKIINRLQREVERRVGLGFKIVSIFSKPAIPTVEIKKEILTTEINVNRLSSLLDSLQINAAPLYDYMLSYPPDWERRRAQVIARDGEQCFNCGHSKHLHLHHIKQLSKGGNNKIDNLKLVCEICHSREHGGRDFSGVFSGTETAFSKRVANINYAINHKKRIKFGYRKPSDKNYQQRIVNPCEIINVDHHTGGGSTLCVRGYCELRKADRTFALKRMQGLKVM